jgi:hypothetical protein
MFELTGAVMLLIAALAGATQVRVVRHGDDRMTGIREVDVLVLPDAGTPARCALARQSLQHSAASVLREAGIAATVSERASSWFYTLRVTTASLEVGGHCVTSLMTELVAAVRAVPDADEQAAPGTWGSLLVGEMVLARATDLIHTRDTAHQQSCIERLRAQVTGIASRVRAHNP